VDEVSDLHIHLSAVTRARRGAGARLPW
jgi:hypothetical protein